MKPMIRILRALEDDPASVPLFKLTDRESDVFELLVKGHVAREVGELLSMGIKTVDTHRCNIFRKLQVSEGRPRTASLTGYVYRHFDKNDRLLYVGTSMNPFMRFETHRIRGIWIQQIAKMTVERFETRELALIAEGNAIRSESPLYNKTDLCN